MVFNLEATIWYILLIDSLGATITAWCCVKWYKKKAGKIAKHFPATKGWCLYYLILVIWIGSILYRFGVLPW